MIEVKEKEIDGAKYMVTQMTARQALKMQAKLIKLLGPCVSELITCFVSKDKENGLSKVVTALATQLDDKTFDQLVFELLTNVRKNGFELNESSINLEFAGALNTLFKVIGFVLEANYSDFLADGGIIKILMELAQKEEPPTSTPNLVSP